MPKIGTPTFISRLYLACLAHNFVALAESIIVVSLHNIVAADQVSEQKLVHTFYESTGGKELMDEVDLKVALHILGLTLGRVWPGQLADRARPALPLHLQIGSPQVHR